MADHFTEISNQELGAAYVIETLDHVNHELKIVGLLLLDGNFTGNSSLLVIRTQE